MQLNVIILIQLLSSFIAGYLLLYAIRSRTNPDIAAFIPMVLTICIWSVTSVFEMASTDLSTRYFWAFLSYFGSQFVSVYFFLFVMRLTRKDKSMPRWVTPFLFILPCFSVFIAATNPLHHLLWSGLYLIEAPGLGVSALFAHGPWYWVEVVYAYSLILLGILFLIQSSETRSRIYCIQMRLIVLASLFPFFGNIIYALYPGAIQGVDLTPIFFTISCIFFFYAISRYQLFDLIPVMHDEVVRSMDEGVIVLDERDRIVEINPAAMQITGLTDQHIGSGLQDIKVICPDMEPLWKNGKETTDIRSSDGRYLSCHFYPVSGDETKQIGKLLIIFDISESRRLLDQINAHTAVIESVSRQLMIANEKLRLLTGITRHDILNELMIIQGYHEILTSQCTDTLILSSLSKADKAAQRIGNYIRFTQNFEKIGIEPASWLHLHTLIDRVVHRYGRDGTPIINLIPDDLEIYCDTLLESVFGNLVENSLRHGGDISRITISSQTGKDEYLIYYEDDGVGIPQTEKEKIFERGHGKNTGMGLFLAREILGIYRISICERGAEEIGVRFEMSVPKDAIRHGFPADTS